ncbi:hypothetical protein [Pseudomonas phage vB_PseuGesM_254]|uniref:Uncharacterized protein n=1 Tax=Pseudomonas phage vB_PseuGesM_254 TaxID=3092638 RepID=A0AAX4G6S0_9CAUD|nr:hypothetical protein [Pseudomonas phage PseuGes_254]
MKQVEKTTAIGSAIKQLMASNKGKFFSVTFTKADNTERTLVGSVRKVPGHNGGNTIGHIEKYLTVVLAEKDEKGCEQFRNVNCETVKSISMGGKKISFS